MRQFRTLLDRVCAYFLSRPAALAAVGTGIELPERHTTLALALSGWGWLFVGTPGATPLWSDWRFFVRPYAHVVVPSDRRVQILTLNVFGTRTLTWTPPGNAVRMQPHLERAPAPALLRPRAPPEWSRIVRSVPPPGVRTRPTTRNAAELSVPFVPKMDLPSVPELHAGLIQFPSVRDGLARCSQLAGSAAASAAASALAYDNHESR